MKLEDQVIDLSYAQRLNKLGVLQYSLFYWYRIEYKLRLEIDELTGVETKTEIEYKFVVANPTTTYVDHDGAWSAFTVSELLDLLPKKIKLEDEEEDLPLVMRYTEDDNIGWDVYYKFNYYTFMDEFFHDTKLENALAKMLIHLIENKLIDLVNKEQTDLDIEC